MAKYSFTEESLGGYKQHYSESGLMSKLTNMALKAGSKVVWNVLLLYYVLKSPGVSARDRTIIISALGYFILPLDLLPDVIPVVGFSDDLAALAFAIKAVYDNITPAVRAQAEAKMRQWFSSFRPNDYQ